MTTDEVINEMRDPPVLLAELVRTRAALRDILPFAEYLRNAPHHPDIAKLENARKLLGI